MTQKTVILAGLALAATLCVTGSANAQEHRRVRHLRAAAAIGAPPLVIKKRSFLDPGNVVPVGSANDYFIETSSFAQPITSTFAPDRYGESVLPGRFDLPYNPRYFPNQDLDLQP